MAERMEATLTMASRLASLSGTLCPLSGVEQISLTLASIELLDLAMVLSAAGLRLEVEARISLVCSTSDEGHSVPESSTFLSFHHNMFWRCSSAG